MVQLAGEEQKMERWHFSTHYPLKRKKKKCTIDPTGEALHKGHEHHIHINHQSPKKKKVKTQGKNNHDVRYQFDSGSPKHSPRRTSVWFSAGGFQRLG
jgi:hypothetical protein